MTWVNFKMRFRTNHFKRKKFAVLLRRNRSASRGIHGNSVSEWLQRNKIYFELISYLFMLALAVLIAFMQYKIMTAQTGLQREQLALQSLPVIELNLKSASDNINRNKVAEPILDV